MSKVLQHKLPKTQYQELTDSSNHPTLGGVKGFPTVSEQSEHGVGKEAFSVMCKSSCTSLMSLFNSV